MSAGTQRSTWDVCWDFARPTTTSPYAGSWNSWEASAYPQQQQLLPLWSRSPTGEWFPPWSQTATAGDMFGGYMPMGYLPRPQPKKGEAEVLPKSLQKHLAEKEKREGKSARGPPPGPPPPPPPSEKEYEGRLKSLSSRNGYGFISCDEISRVYGRDVHLPKDLVPDTIKVADKLKFTVVLSSKGHPQAASVTIIESAE
mmetsp:Transcript_27289/g.63610  ORF Transcript_27289/g.63610 Transcript_27289/m.63610 type:complete len:199 (-) Transcript_27289:49-645(-)